MSSYLTERDRAENAKIMDGQMARSERANLRVRAERMVHIFGGVGVGALIAELLEALDTKGEK